MGEEKLTTLFRIDCGKIYLQEFTVEDAESIYNISNQPEIEKFLPDWKSTKEQRINWVVNYEIPENKAFLHAVRITTNIDDHILKLGICKKTTNEFIGWCCTGIKDELLHRIERLCMLFQANIIIMVMQRKRRKDWLTICSKKRM